MTFAPGFVAQHGRRLFSNLTFLETLDLSYNDLGFLPNDLLSRQPALRKLILLGNNLESLDLDLSFHPNLTLLDLSDNRPSVLSETARFSLDSLAATQRQPLHLHLHGNPLACTCATVEFMRWLGTTRVSLDRGGDYTCVTDSGHLSSTGVEARQWMDKWRRCVGPTRCGPRWRYCC
jgi:Leucine-rich repeat (LRR) protein